ncbi:hypothetical protein M6B38_249535 [Iris pallida]|uniref:Uncharacterized protein n=1 Tax=Iris pallida TaxID=29817 RepID=A0AAX6IJT3_IRIPA|nr:hypothetical protein M6B38_249535 [Iris pallida]
MIFPADQHVEASTRETLRQICTPRVLHRSTTATTRVSFPRYFLATIVHGSSTATRRSSSFFDRSKLLNCRKDHCQDLLDELGFSGAAKIHFSTGPVRV